MHPASKYLTLPVSSSEYSTKLKKLTRRHQGQSCIITNHEDEEAPDFPAGWQVHTVAHTTVYSTPELMHNAGQAVMRYSNNFNNYVAAYSKRL